MQYDVKAAYQAGADGVMVAARTRIKGVFYSVVTAGAAIIFYDNKTTNAIKINFYACDISTLKLTKIFDI